MEEGFKKKKKQAMHTVGVSKEELADARKLIEEISLNDTPSGSNTKLNLSKQNSESSVPTSSASSSYRNVHKIKNATAKPFSSSNSTTSSVQTPTEHFDGFDVLFNDDKASMHDTVLVQQKAIPVTATVKPNFERNTSLDSNASHKAAYKAAQQAVASKVTALKQEPFESEDEDESSTLKGASDLENASLKSNPIYSKPTVSHEEKSSRFDTQKRLRMKRANTIDIPKPLKFYEDDESESEHEDEIQRRRDSSYSLKGPINVGNPHSKKIVPNFTPKTDSDKKFLAFINKHNDNNANKGSLWASNTSVWGNRFGNIKNTFEKSSAPDARSFLKSTDDNITKSAINQYGPRISRRSARNLQQMFEEKQKESQRSQPKYVQSPVKGAPVEKQPLQQQNVVTGTLQVKTAPEKQFRVIPQPLPINQFSHAVQSAFVPIKKTAPHLPSQRRSTEFSPESGEILKSEIQDNNGPSFLYSPKSISSSVESSTVTSPVSSKPWAATTGGGRVLGLAASKFEQPPPQEPPKPRKINRDSGSKVFITKNQTSSNVDRIPNYLSKSSDSNSSAVRKLSGQYENFNNNTVNNQPKPQTYQIKTNVVESQYTQPRQHLEPTVRTPAQAALMSPQNYSTKYNQPQNYSIRYNQPQAVPAQSYKNPQNFQPQNYSIRYDNPQFQTNNQFYQSQLNHQNNSIRYDQPHSNQQHVVQYNQPHNYLIKHDQQQQQQAYPLNYTIRYDQQKSNNPQPQLLQNYDAQYIHSLPATHPNQVYQRVPGKESNQNYGSPNKHETQQYTSSCDFKPSSSKVPVQMIEPLIQPPKVQRPISDESVHEYNAISSRVMSGPVSQQAVTVRQKSPMSRDQHEMDAAFGIKNSLQKFGKQGSVSPAKSPARSPSNSFSYKAKERENKSPNVSQSFKYKSEIENSDTFKYKPSDCPKPTVSPSSFKFKSTFEDTYKEMKNCGVVKPMQQQKATTIYNNTTRIEQSKAKQVNDKRPSVVTGQFHIPAINVKSPDSPRIPKHTQALSKSDSWHEICIAHQNINQKPAPKPGPVKSKSSHSLAVPKMFEAGMSKEEMADKRRTMESFLTGNKSPLLEGGSKTVKRSINRVKTSQKVSTQSRSTGGLCRSRTLPDMVCPELLDESNVDKAFDELFKSS